MIFVIFYIIHYFKLENGVQYVYKQYDKMNKNKVVEANDEDEVIADKEEIIEEE